MLKTKYLSPLILILFLTFALIGDCVTELDYMEYDNDATAQAAYVSSDAAGDIKIVSREASEAGRLLRYNSEVLKFAQAFTVPIDCNVSKVALRLAEGGNIAAGKKIWCYIYDDDSGPNNPISVQSALLEATDISDSNTWYDFTFSSRVKLTAGVQYYIVFTGDYDVSTVNFIAWDGGGTGGGLYNWNGATWSPYGAWELSYKVYGDALQCYSEDTIKQQGTYSLKGIAVITDSLNDTLTYTVDPTIDLTDLTQIKYDIRGSRTGSQIKIGIHDSGGTTTEHTANIAQANVNQTETWDISGVANANKDDIDSIIITIVNADASNTFYIDNMYAEEPEVVTNVMFMFSNF